MQMSRDDADNWVRWDHENPQALEDIQAMLQKAKEVAMKREKALAYAFSQQVFFIILFLLIISLCIARYIVIYS